MSTYNDAFHLKRAIESVLKQNYSDFEFIIINDNSSDNTESVIKSFIDPRIIYLKNLENKGLIYNLNLGLTLAKGEFIARIDSDDWWLDKEKLQKQVEFLENNKDYVLVGTWAKVYNNNQKELFKISYPTKFEIIKATMLIKNCFVHSSVVFRKIAAVNCGNYREQEKYVEDYGLWLRMGEKYKIANIPEYCVGYLLNKQGETQKNNLLQIGAVLKLIKNHKEHYSRYFLAKIKWLLKYILVFCGGLKIINKLKSF